MSSKGGNGRGDYEYLAAARDQMRHTMHEHEVVITCDIRLDPVRCVLHAKLSAFTKPGPPLQRAICSYEVTWPNAGVMSWTAQLFQAYVQLDKLVEESMMDAERALAFKQVPGSR